MTRFIWQRRRRDNTGNLIPLTVAVVVTAALVFLPASKLTGVVELFSRVNTTVRTLAAEQISFVFAASRRETQPRARTVYSAPRPAITLPPTAPEPAPGTPLSKSANRGAPSANIDRDPYVPWTSAPSVPFAPRTVTAPTFRAFPATFTFSAKRQDSVLGKLERSIQDAPTLPPTQMQRDSTLRGEAMRLATARDQARPVPVGATIVSLRVPLFSSGPSRAERRRDSIIHADNLPRLQRLAERAKARRDSIWRMDSIAMLTRP